MRGNRFGDPCGYPHRQRRPRTRGVSQVTAVRTPPPGTQLSFGPPRLISTPSHTRRHRSGAARIALARAAHRMRSHTGNAHRTPLNGAAEPGSRPPKRLKWGSLSGHLRCHRPGDRGWPRARFLPGTMGCASWADIWPWAVDDSGFTALTPCAVLGGRVRSEGWQGNHGTPRPRESGPAIRRTTHASPRWGQRSLRGGVPGILKGSSAKTAASSSRSPRQREQTNSAAACSRTGTLELALRRSACLRSWRSAVIA
jgi:hypothetical protein